MPDLPDRDQPSEEPLPEKTQPKAGPPAGEAGGVGPPPTETASEEGTVPEVSPSPSEEVPSKEEIKTETPPLSEERPLPLTKEVLPEAEVSSEGPPEEPFTPPPPEVPPEKLIKEEPPLPPPIEPPSESPPPEKTEAFRVEGRSPVGLVKKFLFLILIILIVLGLAFIVFRFRSVLPRLPRLGRSEEITLTYWGLWEPENVIKEVLVDWEKEHPQIKVSYTQQSPKEYRERLQSALARGEGPDIFRFHNTWLPMLKNELEPMPATVMDAATYKQSFYPVAASSLRSGANYAGIPLEIDTLALFYNQDIFTAAGVSPPRTWDELRPLASQLTLRDEDGRIQRAGVALGTTGNIWHWSDILGLMMLQNGADLTNPTGSLAEDALTFYTIFTKTDRIWDETLPSSLLAFATGKTAMFFGYSWDVFEIKNTNPNLNFRIVPVPQVPEPETEITWASFWAEGVSRKSKNKEAAWEFLQFLSSKEAMQKLYQAESRLRFFGEPYSRVEMAGLLQADPTVAPFINQASKAETWYLCSRTFDNGINDRMIKYFEDAVNAVNAGGSPAKALSAAASGVDQVLSDYNLGGYTVP